MIRADIITANLVKETNWRQTYVKTTMEVTLEVAASSFRELDPSLPVYLTQEPQ